jgi:hypothetical protein
MNVSRSVYLGDLKRTSPGWEAREGGREEAPGRAWPIGLHASDWSSQTRTETPGRLRLWRSGGPVKRVQ